MSTSHIDARYSCAAPTVADGWRFERLTPPSRLFGANGLRTGPDGRIYIAQVTGSQISALDVGTGRIDTVSAKGGDIVAPDDVAFGPDGVLYATEVMDGRVSALGGDGRSRVLRDDLPCANGITVHEGRLFVNECRDGGRLMELDRGHRRCADPSGGPAVAKRHGGRPRRDALLPADDGQRDLADRPRRR